jgi:hypothetical protein
VKTAASVAAVVCHGEPLRKFALAARLGSPSASPAVLLRLLVSLDQISETVELRHSGKAKTYGISCASNSHYRQGRRARALANSVAAQRKRQSLGGRLELRLTTPSDGEEQSLRAPAPCRLAWEPAVAAAGGSPLPQAEGEATVSSAALSGLHARRSRARAPPSPPARRAALLPAGGVSPTHRGRARSARRSHASRTSWSRSGPARRLR